MVFIAKANYEPSGCNIQKTAPVKSPPLFSILALSAEFVLFHGSQGGFSPDFYSQYPEDDSFPQGLTGFSVTECCICENSSVSEGEQSVASGLRQARLRRYFLYSARRPDWLFLKPQRIE